MDPETEKHLAALIMEEATRLRLQADKEGVHAYLAKPIARGKPNPQFLRATVRGIAQANRAAEVSGMWKRRAMELELEEREGKRGRKKNRSGASTRYRDRSSHSYHDHPKPFSDKSIIGRRDLPQTSSSPRLSSKNAAECVSEDSYGAISYQRDENYVKNPEDDLRDQGLKEEEVENFLHSRVKRGRGSVGSRMDETGPYPSAHSVPDDVPNMRVKEEWEQRIIGPSREFGKRQLVDAKKHRKKRHGVDKAEESSEGASNFKLKKREKDKKKHRSSSHKKSKKKVDE